MLPERFWSKVRKTETCWLWTGALSHGYGAFQVTTGVRRDAHQLSYEDIYGSTGLLILHKCRNKHCVNPEHLYAGTSKENSEDRFRDGTDPTGSKNANAKLTEVDVKRIRFLYAMGGRKLTSLAKEFGVTFAMIGHIVNKKNWRHI